MFFCLLLACTDLVIRRGIIAGSFSADFHSSFQLLNDQVHAEDLVQMQVALNHPQKVNGWSCSFQQWHSSRLACGCLFYSIVKRSGDSKLCRNPIHILNACDLTQPKQTQTSERECSGWRPVIGGRQHRIPAKRSSAFRVGPGRNVF